MSGLLYARSKTISNGLEIIIPSVREVLDNENNYNSLIRALVATPYEMMVELDDIGVNFTEISQYDLFLWMFSSLADVDTSLVFKDMIGADFKAVVNQESEEVILRNDKLDITIDRRAHAEICRVLRKINFLKSEDKTPGNEDARLYMIERARKKQKRAMRKAKKMDNSVLEDLIIALVNTEQYKYDYEGTLNLSIYQFYCCVHQIIKKINYDNLMTGCYMGTVNTKELNSDSLNWLS